MNKHTPGPWTRTIDLARDFTRDDGVTVRLPENHWLWSGRNDKNIGDIVTVVCVAENNALPVEEQRANALLIAAAPELLAACELALEAAANLPSGNEQFDRQILDDVYNCLTAAIAKSRGDA